MTSRHSGAAMKKIVSLLAVLAFAAWAGPANASMLINVSQIAGDVVFSATGSLNLALASVVGGGASYNEAEISGGLNWYLAPGSGGAYVSYAMTSSDGAFGTSSAFVPASSSSGDNFFIWSGWGSGAVPNNEQVAVPDGYVSGAAISSGMVFNGETFASLSLTPGTYNYSIPSDTITLNIVPEPTSLAIFGFGALGLIARGIRRRKRQPA